MAYQEVQIESDSKNKINHIMKTEKNLMRKINEKGSCLCTRKEWINR